MVMIGTTSVAWTMLPAIELAQADPALDRRLDEAVAEVELRRLHRRRVAGDLGDELLDHAPAGYRPAGARRSSASPARRNAPGRPGRWQAAPRPAAFWRSPRRAPPGYGRGSITAIRSPWLTSWPSFTATCISVPSTRARTCTDWNACAVPIPRIKTGTSWRVTRAVVTGTAPGMSEPAGCAGTAVTGKRHSAAGRPNAASNRARAASARIGRPDGRTRRVTPPPWRAAFR